MSAEFSTAARSNRLVAALVSCIVGSFAGRATASPHDDVAPRVSGNVLVDTEQEGRDLMSTQKSSDLGSDSILSEVDIKNCDGDTKRVYFLKTIRGRIIVYGTANAIGPESIIRNVIFISCGASG